LQISCADAVERFQLSLFLILIVVQEGNSWGAIQSMREFRLLSAQMATITMDADAVPAMLTVWCAEVIVDNVKHAFISKVCVLIVIIVCGSEQAMKVRAVQPVACGSLYNFWSHPQPRCHIGSAANEGEADTSSSPK
jgi:hypothetical protein